MWVSYSRHVIDAFNTWDAVGWLLLASMLYGVWRLWRGMRPDAFERGLRALREGRRTTVAFPGQRPTPTPRGGWLQISLLPLMLISCGAAMLLAQATRPDDVSRPATWALFIGVGTWYGARAWPHWRGVGPLRNHALAGVLSGVGVSALLWGFYLAVDMSWGKTSFTRVNASVPSLLWWTAVGGAVGAALGALRANRIYGCTRAQLASSEPPASSSELAVQAAPRRRRVQWGVIAMACCGSLLFHLSAAPHLYRKIDIRYWTWNWSWRQYHHHPGPSLSLTMTPANALPAADNSFVADYLVLPQVQATQIDEEVEDKYSSAAPNYSHVAQFGVQQKVTPLRTINPGQRITSDMLTIRPFPVDGIDLVSDPGSIVGQYAAQRLAPGRPIALGQTMSVPANPVASAGQDAAPLAELIDELDGELAQINEPVNIAGIDILSDLPDVSRSVADAGDALDQVDVTEGENQQLKARLGFGGYVPDPVREDSRLTPVTSVLDIPSADLVQQSQAPQELDGLENPFESVRYALETRPGSSGASPPANQVPLPGDPSEDLFGEPIPPSVLFAREIADEPSTSAPSDPFEGPVQPASASAARGVDPGGSGELVGRPMRVLQGGQMLPSYYLEDDVQYFPAGPEFKLNKNPSSVPTRNTDSFAPAQVPAAPAADPFAPGAPSDPFPSVPPNTTRPNYIDPFAPSASFAPAVVRMKDGRTLRGDAMPSGAMINVRLTDGKVVTVDLNQVKSVAYDGSPPLMVTPPLRVPTPADPFRTAAEDEVVAPIPNDSSDVVPFVPPASQSDGGQPGMDGEGDEAAFEGDGRSPSAR